MSPLHMGNGKENYDFSAAHLHSDTLSAALAAMRVKQGNRSEIEEFISSISISSAFPYVGNHYFFPCPIGRINVSDDLAEKYKKPLKKIKYAEYSLWQDILSGNILDLTANQIQGEFLLESETVREFKTPYITQVNQRVCVLRDGQGDAEPFFFDWKYFRENAGLFCITDAEGEALQEVIRLFTLLGEEGLGTDKSIGGGKFEVEMTSFDMDVAQETNAVMLLSLYIPTQEEMSSIDVAQSRFELILRGGYMAGSEVNEFWHLRKKSIYMMNVGSVLKSSSPLIGKIVDLSPNDYHDERMHSVYRSGMPLVVPIKID